MKFKNTSARLQALQVVFLAVSLIVVNAITANAAETNSEKVLGASKKEPKTQYVISKIKFWKEKISKSSDKQSEKIDSAAIK